MSLASKCVHYRPEHKANEGPLELNFGIKIWDKSTNRPERVDEKMGLKYLKNCKNQIYFQSYGY